VTVRYPIIRPTLPPFEEVLADLRAVWESGFLTAGENVRALEREVAALTGAADCVAVANCTSGLMLALKVLDLEPGEVVVPAFTFAATAHAAVWNGHDPVFVDCLPGTMNVDPQAARRAITPRTRAILVTHIFGVPADADELAAIAGDAAIPLLFDAAQALGARYRGRMAGALAPLEVFSMSPTKVVTAAEGGLITTSDPRIGERLRRLRDYGKSKDGQDMDTIGLSARLSELHAVVARACLRHGEAYIARRTALIARYRAALGGLPGVTFQEVPEDRTTSGNYMVIRVGDRAPLPRDALYRHLAERGVQAKKYFWPAVHRQTAYRRWGAAFDGRLPEAERAAEEGLALPLYGHMTDAQADDVTAVVREAFGRESAR